MFKLKATVFGLIFSLALLQNVLAAETAPAPVILTHAFTGYSTAGDTVTLGFTVHVVNTGDNALSGLTLSYLPSPPVLTGTSLGIGNLGPHQSADFPLKLAIRPHINPYGLSRRPILWAGKCVDAQGNLIQFPVTSLPGGGAASVKEQAEPAGGNPVAPVIAHTALAAADSQPAPGDFLFKWGTPDTIQSPYGAAVDTSGNIYVADTNNNRIQVFDNKGASVKTIGSFGSDNGRFDRPYGVAVDANGNLYVADTANWRVQVFDNTGTFARSIDTIGYGDAPYGVAVDASGNLYVADPYNYRVQVFDATGAFVRNIGSLGSGNGQFNDNSVWSVAVDAGGNVYAADSGNERVQLFDNTGAFVRSIGSHGSGDGQFTYPWGVAVDAGGDVYVADIGSDRVQVFDGNGVFVRSMGSFGNGGGQLYNASGVAVDANGNVYVADTGNNRAQVLDSTGTFVRSIGSPGNGQFNNPRGVAVDNSGGNIYVADTGNNRVQVFDNTGSFIRSMGSLGSGNGQFIGPNGVAVDASGNLYVADNGNPRIQVFDNTGTFIKTIGGPGSGNGRLTAPEDVAVDANGNIYVDDRGADGWSLGMVFIFDNTGTFVRNIAVPSVRGVAVDTNGNVYVPAAHDWGGAVKVFDNTGTFVRDIGSGQVQCFGDGITADSSGDVYVTDIGFPPPDGRVLVFDTTGNLKGTWGSEGSGDGQFNGPGGVVTNASGTIAYVADAGNNRVEAFAGYGTPSFTVNFVAGTGGAISGTASQTVTSGGNTAAVSAVPDSGYRFVNWTGDNGFAVTTENPLTVTNVTASRTITANFAANAPLATTATVSGTAGANGWYVSDVGIYFSAFQVKEIHARLDNGAVTVTAGSAASMSIASEGYHTVAYYAVDNAGNRESPHTLSINIDKTPPAIKITGIKKGAVYVLGRKIPAARYAVKDKLSGGASRNASLTGGNANHAGVFTYTVTASDNAGNSTAKAVTYTVRYLFSGFLPRRGKEFSAGRTVPVTFQLRDADRNYISTASATLMLKSPDGAPVTPASGTNADNVFQYDPTTDRYIYNLNTLGLTTGNWQLQVTLDDGSPAKTTYIILQ